MACGKKKKKSLSFYVSKKVKHKRSSMCVLYQVPKILHVTSTAQRPQNKRIPYLRALRPTWHWRIHDTEDLKCFSWHYYAEIPADVIGWKKKNTTHKAVIAAHLTTLRQDKYATTGCWHIFLLHFLTCLRLASISGSKSGNEYTLSQLACDGIWPKILHDSTTQSSNT